MSKFIVTSGQQFTDIDAYACTIAYSELLNLVGQQAEAVLPGPLNASLTESIRSWSAVVKKAPSFEDSNYVLVDISDPKELSSFVNQNKIFEIYDHRYGFEKFWQQKLGKNAHIEMVGSCATLIWERFKKSGKATEISFVSANLLYTAVISNTLNFQSSVTTDRDLLAFNELKQHTRLPDDWVEIYYRELDSEVNNNIEFATRNDTKTSGPVIAQLELWNAKGILLNHLEEILTIMESFGKPDWFLTSPSISEGKNYIITKDETKKRDLEKVIGAKFDGVLGTTEKLWLRKEIIRELSKL